ncbi:hypothetical protein A1O7_04738 [Cladophialophora yegresii CBS 114405]|uniref:Major facilitator superfamily (MFS) profile domain-containing protein n=1 Tax=Cladophialophora yegresii CBS 114405 TaxID=1182544 RepID=W9W6G1_9EURO|nr:uncharacterized protein A1O7_04738 [Cladophialophora yegresii CBS 114405]EXJ60585.1 hypothetical protein A1O7_04738 [Cladophialophora yegresii CBS 114405]
MTKTQTMTLSPVQEIQPPGPSPRETFELSLKAPGKSLRELSRRVVHGAPSAPSSGRASSSDEEDTIREEIEPPTDSHAVVQVQRWNEPKGNIARLGFSFFSFIVTGLNDGAVGALIPYLETYYHLSYTTVSLIFLTPFAGYSLAAFTNASIHSRLGQRGIVILAPLCHIITYAILSAHPPFPVLVISNTISGFGNGLTDACFCAWIGVMDKANAVQGCLHSCYSLGALFAPLIATSMVVHAKLPWYTFYYFMAGASVLELVGLTVTFWRKTGAVYRLEHPRETTTEAKGGRTREALKSKITWICSLFFFTYMGVEGDRSDTFWIVGLGGWIVTFMLRVRSASPSASGYSGTGFWAGMALGRATLGFVTERFGERTCISIYLALCLALQLVFWLVPKFIVSAVAVALLGFFLGPMFPGCVMMAAKLLPKHIHVSAIGFAMAIGGTGGTVFPFAIGAIASSKGVKVLQPIVLALLVVLLGLWLSFPRLKKRE